MRVVNDLIFGEINLVCVASSLLSVPCYTLWSFSPLSPVSVLVSGDLDVKLLPENRVSNIMMVFRVDVMQRAFFSCCKLLAK